MNIGEGAMVPSLFVSVKLCVGEYYEAKGHFESKESLGKVCVPRHGIHGFQMVSFRSSQLTGSKQSIYNNLYCAVNRVYSAPEGLVARWSLQPPTAKEGATRPVSQTKAAWEGTATLFLQPFGGVNGYVVSVWLL